MISSMNARAPSCGDGYNVRGFRADDLMYLIDIDAKCSDYPWCYDQWVKGSDHFTGSVVTYYGTPVGFAMFRRMGEYVELVNFAVKPQYRRQKLGLGLFFGCLQFAKDMGCRTIFVVLPETLFRQPPEPHEPAIPFLMRLGFKAVKPMIRDCFNVDGCSIAGVKFTHRIEQPNPRKTP